MNIFIATFFVKVRRVKNTLIVAIVEILKAPVKYLINHVDLSIERRWILHKTFA